MTSYYLVSTSEDYLAHYGTKRHSGRYPWGSGEKPYQSTGGVKGNSFFQKRKEKKHQAEILKKKKELLEATKKETERIAAEKAEKEQVRKLPTATLVQKYAADLSTDEIDAALTRIKSLREIDKYAALEAKELAGPAKKPIFDTVDDIFGKISKANKWADTSINVYNNFKAVGDMLDAAAKNYEKTGEYKLGRINKGGGDGGKKK